ncbi:MAG: hypothetical protein EHM78_07155 [Myxococcaceae bacterium]|nr:MAG: hypothetical protein EHM78_07155 [Myxococcaceae bacterium]
MPSATGDTGAEQPMRAWKFLDPGRIAPFGGHVWSAPSTSGPGAWVEPAGGVFACRLEDLPWWIRPELWEVELAGPVRMLPTQVAAARGRLLRRVLAWDEAVLRAYGMACAERARDRAVHAFLREDRQGEGDALRRTRSMLELYRTAQGMATDARTPSSNAVGYFAACALRAAQGEGAAAALHAADAVSVATGDPDAFARERQWQAAWIAGRCALSAEPVAVV